MSAVAASQQEALEVSSEFFDVVPDARRARRLGKSYRELLVANLLRGVEHAEAGLGVEVPELRERIASLDPTRRFSPVLYVGFSQLADSFRTEAPARVLDALQWLCVLEEREIHDSRFRLASILEEWWEKSFVAEIRKPPTKDHAEGAVVIQPLLETDLSDFEAVHDDALQLIEEVDEGMWAEITEYVSRLKLFVGGGIQALSSPRVFGAVYLQLPSGATAPGPYCLEHLVHETSHLALNALMAHDQLLENPHVVHPAPIRPDPRPLYQVLHGTFVLARNLRVFSRLAEQRPKEFPLSAVFENSAAAYARGYETLAQVAEWTPAGADLFASFDAPSGVA